MSYMTKIDKSITSKLHFIIKKYITKSIDANIIIQKLSNVFFNVHTNDYSTCYLPCVFFLPLYHSSRTF
jgi:hypothetical protein